MKKMLCFLKSTNWVSKILFCLWIFFSIFVNFSNESRLQIILEFGAVFLTPSILIEIFKNPVLKKKQKDLPVKLTKGLGEKLKKLMFPFRWVYTLPIAMWIYGTFFSADTQTDGLLVAAITYGIPFIVPIIVLEIALYVKKHRKPVALREKNINANPDRYVSARRIIGLVLLPSAILFVIIGVVLNSNTDTYASNNTYPGIAFSVISLLLLLSSVNDPKTKTEAKERKKAKLSKTLASNTEEPKESNCADEVSDVYMVDGMEGHEFEHFCANLLRKNGFYEVSVTKGSGDQGVDILATKDGIKYAIQCKNYSSPLSNTPVQEISAGKIFYNCHVGVVLTNSTFTPGAISLANATGVLLWDRNALAKLMRNDQPATEKATKIPIETPSAVQPKDTTPTNAKVATVVPAPQVNPHQDIQQSPK